MVSFLLVSVIAIIARAAIALNPGLLELSRHTQDRKLAQRAAESGLEYAQFRLKNDPTWRGEGNAITIDTPELFVQEQNGNVIGLVTEENGELSQFRVRFNFQDGDGGGDGMDNPPSDFWIDHPYVSYNNTGTPGHAPLPRGLGTQFAVENPSEGEYQVPGQAVYVLVEGRSGPGLEPLNRNAPNAVASGSVSEAVVETCFQASLSQEVTHAAIMAGGDLNLTIPQGEQVILNIRGDIDDKTPRLRSKGSVRVTTPEGAPGNLSVAKSRGEIGRDPSANPGFFGNLTGEGAGLLDEHVGDGADFYSLEWDDVTQAGTDPINTVRIPAGTYVMWDDETLHYYDMNLDDYGVYMSNPANHSDPGVKLSGGLPEVRTPENRAASRGIGLFPEPNGPNSVKLSLNIKKETRIVPTDRGVTDFTVMSRGGAAYSPDDDSLVIPGAGDGWSNSNVQVRLDDALLSAPGDVNILGRLVGQSSTITVEGKYTQISPSSVIEKTWNDPEAQNGLNVYAQGEVKISTFLGDGFGRSIVSGLVYTWDDFECLAGHPDISTDRWGETTFRGTLVAYGSEPGEGTPGSAGQGEVNISGSEIKLGNNFNSIADVVQPQADGTSLSFRRSLYVTH